VKKFTLERQRMPQTNGRPSANIKCDKTSEARKSGVYGYRACPECGAIVQRAVMHAHECAPERFISHQMAKARHGLDRLEEDLAGWLATPRGAFQAFLARRLTA
jgi:hypothetical protein